ncbi:MAG: hypothetical protein JRG89_12605 [Deltaproteobacteria bacterium]|nr:hypothetical protein [Deltaproteobacteria bacterium]MBW2389261.1 hypothetical protein [Deltaproteobacteria bacterium]MBW2723340.1 hypothetical protein [Deltaproteobacteria bacterium]
MPDQTNSSDSGKVFGFFATAVAGEHAGETPVISPEEILYVFLAGARGPSDRPDLRRIFSRWIRKIKFSKETVYIRTRNGLYASHVRTLADFAKRSPLMLWRTNQSVLIHPANIAGIEFRDQTKKIHFAVSATSWSWPDEAVEIGKTYISQYRRRFAIGRGPSRGGASSPPPGPMTQSPSPTSVSTPAKNARVATPSSRTQIIHAAPRR